MQSLPPPNYTQSPNILFDTMPDLSDSELRIMLAAIRKTLGWHRNDPQPMGVSWFQEQTGLSAQGARNGIKQASERGWLQFAGTGERGVHLYVVNFVDPSTSLSSETPAPLNVVDPYKERDVKERDSGIGTKEVPIPTPSGVQPQNQPTKDNPTAGNFNAVILAGKTAIQELVEEGISST